MTNILILAMLFHPLLNITPKPHVKALRTYCSQMFSVRRQGFWNQWALKLRESLAHLFGLIMRRAGGDASVALRVSFV